ncbi:serine/threonine protein kinase [Sphaerospermopsis reniformis]|uniref:Serine/threonine protein kinase n=1 Tax=Sphaerospermopsis reniformis TaxID=531300 RepID=A0A479ZTW0_9CYAN|nr:hypothetical protein [Sphaerospermopsis reniformis]GCL36139.1 serine/threonine protein kinase [Sphaerospermopsis reniformis]
MTIPSRGRNKSLNSLLEGHCTHVLSSSIAPIQRERLQEWLEISKVLTSSADAQVSKNFLKQEYEKIKRQILATLQTSDTGSSFDISG